MTMINRRHLLAAMGAMPLAACSEEELGAILGEVLAGSTAGGGLTAADAAAGIRAALNQGTGTAISQVGQMGGYFNDSSIRIPLPRTLANAQQELSRFGLSGSLDELQRQINRGAEEAAPQARTIFVDAIRAMTIRDALGIVRGSDTAATEYFQRETTSSLTNLFNPMMQTALQRTGAIRTFDNLVARLRTVPLAPQLGADAKTDLINHGVSRGLDGLFFYVAREEQAIRQNPARRTSEILRRVFA